MNCWVRERVFPPKSPGGKAGRMVERTWFGGTHPSVAYSACYVALGSQLPSLSMMLPWQGWGKFHELMEEQHFTLIFESCHGSHQRGNWGS